MSTPPPSPSAPPPGWMPDPTGVPGVQRWWDGAQWTEHTQQAGPSPSAPSGGGKTTRGCLIGCGGLLALLLVLGALSAAFSGGGDTGGGSAGSGDTSAESGGGDDEPTVSVGRPLALEGTRYEVTSATTQTTIGENEFTQETADGTFVVVELELTNLKNDTRTISSEALKLVTRDGREYSTSDDALLAIEDQFLFEDVQPNLTTKGTLVFDVPPAATRGARLRVEDLFGGDTGFVRLGLD